MNRIVEFTTTIREYEVEIKAGDYEYTPEINLHGPQMLEAVHADTGEEFEFEGNEEILVFDMATDMFETD